MTAIIVSFLKPGFGHRAGPPGPDPGIRCRSLFETRVEIKVKISAFQVAAAIAYTVKKKRKLKAIKNHQNKMKKALRKLTMFSIFKKSLTKPELLWEGVRTHLLDGG